MKLPDALFFGRAFPCPPSGLPAHAVIITAVHVYLAAGHFSKLFGGDVQWTQMVRASAPWPEPTRRAVGATGAWPVTTAHQQQEQLEAGFPAATR